MKLTDAEKCANLGAIKIKNKKSMTWHKSMFVGGHMFMAMVRMEPICRICLNAG